MATISWHPNLPQTPLKGFTETGGVLLARTPMDKGMPKMRRLGQRARTMNMTFLMTEQQVGYLEDFVHNTLKGVFRFNFNHPRTRVTEEVRIVPSGDGQLFNLTYIAPGYYNVELQMEVLP
jgi:hypothetical protein